MKVIEITKKQDWSEQRKKLFDQNGISCQCVSPTLLSPFTAMKVRRSAKSSNASAIIVGDMRNAMAALSARQILSDKIKIVYTVLPNSKPPKGIPTALAQGIDAWIFPTERQRALYSSELKNAIVIPTADIDACIDQNLEYAKDAKDFLWIGPIDGNEENLKKAIEAIDALPYDCKLKIAGTGKAQNVMPAVRKARAICHPSRIEWLGAEYSIRDAIANVKYVVQAGLDPTDIEMGLAANLSLITTAEIYDLESAQPVAPISADEAVRLIAEYIKNLQ